MEGSLRKATGTTSSCTALASAAASSDLALGTSSSSSSVSSSRRSNPFMAASLERYSGCSRLSSGEADGALDDLEVVLGTGELRDALHALVQIFRHEELVEDRAQSLLELLKIHGALGRDQVVLPILLGIVHRIAVVQRFPVRVERAVVRGVDRGLLAHLLQAFGHRHLHGQDLRGEAPGETELDCGGRFGARGHSAIFTSASVVRVAVKAPDEEQRMALTRRDEAAAVYDLCRLHRTTALPFVSLLDSDDFGSATRGRRGSAQTPLEAQRAVEASERGRGHNVGTAAHFTRESRWGRASV
eukprot:scaffold2224_cov261-Pinguiococcus_pyrenoidosus.AAC.53